MIIARKIDSDNIYFKLTLIDENEEFELDGYKKFKLPSSLRFNSELNETVKTKKSGVTSRLKSYRNLKSSRCKSNMLIKHFPSHNQTVKRIFTSISLGNYQEVEYSIRFVCLQDFYYNNMTVAIASLFCNNSNRKIMMNCLMKWGYNFEIEDLVFKRDAIHWCCIMKLIDEFHMIMNHLDWQVDYRKRDVDGNTYLHLSIMSNSLDLVEAISSKMRDNSLSGDICNYLGLTPYILSRKLGHRHITKYLESHKIVSLNVCDNVSYLTPREWSILGHAQRQNNNQISLPKLSRTLTLFNNDTNEQLVTFQQPSTDGVIPTNLKNASDINGVLHAAYLTWSVEHMDSFRKYAKPKESDRKSQSNVVLPPIHKKNKKEK